jgi:hypothetical protein
VANYQWIKTVLRMCFVQTLQRVKVNRCLQSNEDSMNAQREGKTKFLFSIPLPARSVHPSSRMRVFQRNGSETTWAGIGPDWLGKSAAKFVPGLLKPRLM